VIAQHYYVVNNGRLTKNGFALLTKIFRTHYMRR